MDTQNVVYPYNRILFSITKEANSAICYMCINLGDIMLTEISQSQKEKYCMIPLTQGTEISQNHRDGKWNGGCQGLGEGRREGYCLIGIEFQIYKSYVDE